MRSFLILATALTLGLTGCASGGGGGGGGARSSANVLTAQDLEPVMTLDCYQAIQRLRARWLRPRGGIAPVVLLDGNRQGGLETLRNIRVSEIQEIRYRNGRDATIRYGTGFDGGTIEIKTKS